MREVFLKNERSAGRRRDNSTLILLLQREMPLA
jgi:hypothetical protein